jgi:outer membrane protein OmpA-like peptidoglycan-associated protein
MRKITTRSIFFPVLCFFAVLMCDAQAPALRNYKAGDTISEVFQLYDTTGVKKTVRFPGEGHLIIYRYHWKDPGKGAETLDSVLALERKVSAILSERPFENTHIICISYNRGADYASWLQKIKTEKPFSNNPRYKVDYYNTNGDNETELKIKNLISKVTIVDPKGVILRFASTIARFDYNLKNRKNTTIRAKLLTETKGTVHPLAEAVVHLIASKSKDTLATTVTNTSGEFELTYRAEETEHTIKVKPKDNATSIIVLTTHEGKEISKMQKGSLDFEYHLLKTDEKLLSEMHAEDITLKFESFNTSPVKEIITPESIFYELRKSEVTESSKPTLDKIVSILNENPTIKVEIISHTDAQGDDEGNLKLSEKRAAAVAEYIKKSGIAKERISSSGKGEKEIRNRCTNGVQCTDKMHEYNRRTEFRFTKDL